LHFHTYVTLRCYDDDDDDDDGDDGDDDDDVDIADDTKVSFLSLYNSPLETV
jgi:hypothetical protein